MATSTFIQGRNPLYNNVYQDVKYELSSETNSRTRIYGNRIRGRNGLDWHLAKKSYCVVSWYDSKSRNKEEILGINADKMTFPALYNQSTNFPNPTLSSVNVTNQGELGSLQTAEVSFKVYTREQLNDIEEKILIPGQEVIIEYGWTTNRVTEPSQRVRTKFEPKIDPNRDTFKGIVYDYNLVSNTDLTFDVSFSAVGEGFFSLGISANAKDKNTLSNSPEFAIDSNGEKLIVDSLKIKIKKDIADQQKRSGGKSGVFIGRSGGTGIRYAYQPIAYDSSTESSIDLSEKNSLQKIIGDVESTLELNRPPEKTIYYIPLADLLYYYNMSVLSQEPKYGTRNGKKPKVWFSANKDGEQEDPNQFPYGVRSISIYDNNITSCIPAQILFNGGISGGTRHSANYSYFQDSVDRANGNFRIEPSGANRVEFERQGGEFCNLGEILISTDTIIELLDKLAIEEKEPIHKTVTVFFNNLFQKINYASGTLYQLTFIQEEIVDYTDGESQRSWIIVVDKNFTYDYGQTIKPLRFNVESSLTPIVKRWDMSSKIPNAMGTKLYVGGRTDLTDISGDAGKLSKNKQEQEEIREQTRLKSLAVYDNLRNMRNKMGETGSTEVLRQGLHSLLKSYRESPEQNTKLWVNQDFVNQTLFPINLSITIDGISGFRFGNVVEIDYLPKRYFDPQGNPEVVFIVTKVNHTITPATWETTLQTQCRANMRRLG